MPRTCGNCFLHAAAAGVQRGGSAGWAARARRAGGKRSSTAAAAARLAVALTLVWSAATVGCVAGCWPLFEEPLEGVAARERERAARAPIIVVAHVERTLRVSPQPLPPHADDDESDEQRDEERKRASIYSVEARIMRVIKGADAVWRAREAADVGGRRLHRVGNFGGFKWCFSEVDAGKTYVLYLKLAAHGHLAAFYATYGDAAEPWSSELEDALIEQTQGYRPWADWSACSASCDGGVMRRSRVCVRGEAEPCTEGNVEKKHCNTFPCSRARNLLAAGGLGHLDRGVLRLWEDGRLHYDITPNFYAQFPLARLFDAGWPANYTVLARVRPRRTRYPRKGQYLFSVADAGGEQSLGLRLYPTPSLELTAAGATGSRLHETASLVGVGQLSDSASGGGLNDGRWHAFAFAVRGGTVETYYRCHRRAEQALSIAQPAVSNARATNVVLGTRMRHMERGSADRYEGTIDQLVVTADPDDASRQCSAGSWTEATPQLNKPKSGIRRQCGLGADDKASGGCAGDGVLADKAAAGSELQASQASGHWAWSDWSPCSSSCGAGRKTRVPRCLLHSLPPAGVGDAMTAAGAAAANGPVNLDDCIPYYVPPVHIKECYEAECPYCQCENGGTCVEDVCACPPGWTGELCQQPVCDKGGCGSHGACTRPGVCECSHGWSGERCDIPWCYPACRNGGSCTAPDTCRCPPGYTGANCAVRVVRCSAPCQNGGTCSGMNTCDCPPEYSGRHCEAEATTPTCSPPCRNNATCGRGNVCRCPSGYLGARCERDACGGCRNGGVCNGTSHSCICSGSGPAQHTGPLCEHEVQPHKCQGEQACLNGGLCVDYNTCSCPPGLSGRRCEYRTCRKHRVVSENRTELVRKRKYRYFTCPHSAVAVCREPAGYEVEAKVVPGFRVDTSQCED